MEKILSIYNLEIKYLRNHKVFNVVRNVSLDFFENETLILVGESGSGKSVIAKAIVNLIESNGWISGGSISYFPTQVEKNDVKFNGLTDLVEHHREFLLKNTVSDVTKYYLRKIKDSIRQLKLIECLDVQKSLEIEDKYSKKLDKIQIASELNKSQKLVYRSSQYIYEIKKWRKYIYLQHDEVMKKQFLENLIKEIEEYKIEAARIKNLSSIEKTKLKKIISLIKKNHDEKYVFSDDDIYLFKKYFNRHDYLNDVENNIKECWNKIISGIKIDDDYYLRLLRKWETVRHTNFWNKIKFQREASIIRGSTIATIFRNPQGSLNPILSIGFQIVESICKHKKMNKLNAKKEALRLLERVGFKKPVEVFSSRASKLTLLEKQKINLIMAIANKPRILICDESVASFDLYEQTEFFNLLQSLKEEYKFTLVITTKDIRNCVNFSDRIAIMYAGQIIEIGSTNEILFKSEHPYTWSLLLSIPEMNIGEKVTYSISGSTPDLSNKIVGDAFAPRNKHALKIDWIYEPPMYQVSDTHFAKTWLLDYRSPKVERPKKLKNTEKIFK